ERVVRRPQEDRRRYAAARCCPVRTAACDARCLRAVWSIQPGRRRQQGVARQGRQDHHAGVCHRCREVFRQGYGRSYAVRRGQRHGRHRARLRALDHGGESTGHHQVGYRIPGPVGLGLRLSDPRARSSSLDHVLAAPAKKRYEDHNDRNIKPRDEGTGNMKDQNYAETKTAQIRLAKRSPEYWRVTFDPPPLNIFGPEMLPQVNEIITAIETDERVKVVVFDSAVEGFFLIHLDFLSKLDDMAHLAPGPTGLHPWPEMIVRLSRTSVVSIALIRGRATGMGSELALACDMRFASRERA